MFKRNLLKRVFQLLVGACVIASASWAADASGASFVGDWKLNLSKSKVIDIMKVGSVGANQYSFDFGAGKAESIVADGTDQPGIFGTTLAVTVEGPNAWKVVRKKDGRILLTGYWKLSEDGNTLKDNYTEFAPNGSPTTTIDYVYARTAGTSGFAGNWESAIEPGEADVLQVRAYQGDGLSFIDTSDKETKNLKFDGKDYPDAGPNETPGSTSSIRRVNEHTLEVTGKVNGKVRDTREIELSSDLKTLTMTVHREGRTKSDILVFERQ